MSLELREGRLRLTEVILESAEGSSPTSAQVKVGDQTIPVSLQTKQRELRLVFQNPLVLATSHQLKVRF